MAPSVQNTPTAMQVVAGALRDQEGRWLLQKRPINKRHGGLWEFPGGKVEPGESLAEALVRELAEELSIVVPVHRIEAVGRANAAAGGGEPATVITLYKIATWEGEPQAEEGAECGWFYAEDIDRLPLPPLDRELAAQLFAWAG